MNSQVLVEKLDVGYLVSTSGTYPRRRACMDLQETFRAILFELEGLTYHFSGNLYGDVEVMLAAPPRTPDGTTTPEEPK